MPRTTFALEFTYRELHYTLNNKIKVCRGALIALVAVTEILELIAISWAALSSELLSRLIYSGGFVKGD